MEEKGETPQKVRGKSSESLNAVKKKKKKREKDGWEGGSRTGQEGAWPVFHCGAGVLRRVQLFVTPWTVACQSSLSMGFHGQEYWSGLPCPPPGDLPDPGIEPASLVFPALQANSLPLSHLGEGNGNPLQYSCLENPMDGRAWWAAVHGVTKSWTQLSVFTFTFHFHALEKEMATHSSVLAWRIPGMGEAGGLLSMGSYRVGHQQQSHLGKPFTGAMLTHHCV